jgi:MFS family permease
MFATNTVWTLEVDMTATAPPIPAQSPPASPALSGPYRWRWIVLAVVLAAEVMDLMDATIVNVAGPSIRADLGGGATTLQWLSAAYTLAFAVLLVTGARLGDIYGRRRLFLIGSAGFTAMSAACALATSPGMLIATRVLQARLGRCSSPRASE